MIHSNLVVNDVYIDLNRFIDQSISKLNDIIYDTVHSDLYSSIDCEEKVRNLKNELLNYFKLNHKDLKQNRRSSDIKVVDEILFALICFFDEIFISLNWNGRQYWRLDSMEKALYTSQAGGDIIFNAIEKIITEKNPKDAELAKIYYTLLKLGFKGRYRERDFTEKYEELTEKLNEIYNESLNIKSEFDKPSYYNFKSKYEDFIKKENIHLIIKYIFFSAIIAFLIGEIYWLLMFKLN